jgi:putative FmdB family regulatory protein
VNDERMPIYEYRCEDCEQVQEHLQKVGAEAPPGGCASCGGTLKRKFSRVAVKYEGWGFASTDSLVGNTQGKDFKALRERAERIAGGDSTG